MASNPFVNHVELADGTMLMDIRDTTADAESVENGRVFYSASGARTIGAMPVKLDQVAAYVEYSDSGTYSVGDIRTHGGRIYRCNTAIAEAEEWDSTHWTEVTIGELLFGKADKVSGATSGHVATLDGNGNLIDSGKTLGVSVPANAVFTDHYAWSDITSKPETATRWPAWSEVTGKPSTFTPSSHTHDYLPLSGGTITGSLTVNGTINSYKMYVGGAFNVNDTRTSNGFWIANAAITNAPTTNHGGVLGFGSVGTPCQYFFPDNSLYTYKRWYTSGAWTAWQLTKSGYADSAGSVAWGNVTSKPNDYPGGCTGNAASATKWQTARSLWGNSVNGTADVNGTLLSPNGIKTGSRASGSTGSGVEINDDGGIEIFHSSTPFIDFHYQASTSDYSVRLLCNSATNLNCTGTISAKGFTGNVTGNCSGSAGSVAWGNVSGKPTILKIWEGSVKFSSGSVSLSSTLGSSAQIYSCTFNNLGNMGPIIFGCAGVNLLAIILQINNGNLVYHNYSGTITVRVIYA